MRQHGGIFIIRNWRYGIANVMPEDGERSQLENLRWLAHGPGWKPRDARKLPPIRTATTLSKNTSTNLGGRKSLQIYVTEEELAAERERQEAGGETPLHQRISRHELKKKKLLISQNEAAGIIPTVRLAVNDPVSTSGMIKGDIEFGRWQYRWDWVIQKKDIPNLQLCRCHRWPRYANLSRHPWR